jgi:hypothetical protein
MTTVKDLREMLEGRPDDMRIVVRGYEGGFKDIDVPEEIKIKLNVNKQWWYGPHDIVEDGCTADERALLI